jgi:hypothetical protein
VDGDGLAKMARDISMVASDMDKRAMVKRRAGLEKWAKQACDPANGTLYRWMRSRQQATTPNVTTNEDGSVAGVETFVHMCRRRAGTFTDVWERKDKEAEEDLAYLQAWLKHGERPGSDLQWLPGPDDIIRTSLTFPWGKAFSSDAIHPRQLSLLDDSSLWCMINIFHRAMSGLAFPQPFALLLMKLIGKFDDAGTHKGERSVGLFAAPTRVFMRALRRGPGSHWMKGTVPSNWYGVEDRPTHQAVWSMATLGQYAKDSGRSATATLFDIQKAFDHIK